MKRCYFCSKSIKTRVVTGNLLDLNMKEKIIVTNIKKNFHPNCYKEYKKDFKYTFTEDRG